MGIIIPPIPPIRPVIVKGGVALSNNHTLLENAIGVFLLIMLATIASTIIWYYIEVITEKKEVRPKLIIKSFIGFLVAYISILIFCGLTYLIMDKFF